MNKMTEEEIIKEVQAVGYGKKNQQASKCHS